MPAGDNATPTVPKIPQRLATTWTEGVQTGLAWTVISVFAIVVLALSLRVIVSSAADDSLELLKQGINALINIVMVVMGYFFGSSKTAQGKDDTIAKIALEPNPPIPPVTTTTTVDQNGASTTVTEPAKP